MHKKSRSEIMADKAYYWSKIRQAILAEDPASIVCWTIIAMECSPRIGILIRGRVVDEFSNNRPTMDQIIAAVQEATP
jgi:hypothetical protein